MPDVDPRAIESYAVPAAILAVARGMTDTQAEQILGLWSSRPHGKTSK